MARRALVATVVGWSLVRLLCGAPVALADAAATHPRPADVGVVVTAREVFVSWRLPSGTDPKSVVVRRGEPTCPRTPSEGTAAGETSPLHVIDQGVSPGKSYCYTVFAATGSGGVSLLTTTGPVGVPDTHVVPPVNVAAPTAVTATSQTHVDTTLTRRVGLAVAAALAGMLALYVLVRTARRVGDDRDALRPTMRGSLASRNSGALVVPAMIALGWVVVVIGFVVLR
jgi:hypothetical protein